MAACGELYLNTRARPVRRSSREDVERATLPRQRQERRARFGAAAACSSDAKSQAEANEGAWKTSTRAEHEAPSTPRTTATCSLGDRLLPGSESGERNVSSGCRELPFGWECEEVGVQTPVNGRWPTPFWRVSTVTGLFPP